MSKNNLSLMLKCFLLIIHFLFKEVASAFVFELYLSLMAGVAIAAISILIVNNITKNYEQE